MAGLELQTQEVVGAVQAVALQLLALAAAV
jgi:hypothetical protein